MELAGTSEIAVMLQVSRQYVDRLARTEGFPEPIDVISAGRIWRREDIEAWARETGRIK